MMIAWLVYGLLVSTLLAAAAWLLERAARVWEWPGRGAWAGALAGSVAFPAWAWLTPSSEPAGAAGPLPGAYVMEALPPLVLQPTAAAGPSVELVLALAWAAASGVLLAWLGMSAARLRSAERGWGREELDGVAVLVSERMGPAAMGVIRGRVVLPRWALGLDARLRRLMVLHEAEHVRARDPQLAVAGLLLCALMPWNVAAWWQLRRLRLAIEMDCDARVLRRAGDVRSYGALLLEVGQRRGARLALGLAETRTSLEKRIRMMTRMRTGRGTARALALGGLSALVLAVACETPGPTEVGDPERRPMELDDVQGEIRLRAAGTGEECEPVFFLNGAPLKGSLEDIAPDGIATIDILKGAEAREEGGDCGLVLILTKDATPAELRAAEELASRLRLKAPTRSPAELAEAPRFTPMTARPTLKNTEDVNRLLQENYPPLLKGAGIGGTVNVWFFIAADGTVGKALVNTTSGHDAFDQAALRVARRMEFTPAYLRDQPTPVWVALDITFDMKR